MSTTIAETVFHCPGDPQPVSRSVHLARLAAGYAGCRQCPQRTEAGTLPQRVVRSVQRLDDRGNRPLIAVEGIRGLYLNELTRERMALLVGHALNLVEEDETCGAGSPRSLQVAVGHDARYSSPDLAVGVVSALRLAGCEIADLSQLSRPAFDYAVDRLRPDLGLYVTGGIEPENWNGLDVLGADGRPWCSPGRLDLLAERLPTRPVRARRQPGIYHLVDMASAYETALRGEFHAIRPLRLVISCYDPLTRSTLMQLLESTPCVVHPLSVSPGVPSAEQQRQLADAMRDRHADAGFLIAADGRACTLFDERGVPVDVDATLRLLSAGRNLEPLGRRDRREIPVNVPTEAELLSTQNSDGLPVVTDGQGRYWFRDAIPRCAAILTLSQLLQGLSLSDRLVSDWC